jgi:hypothetical protein
VSTQGVTSKCNAPTIKKKFPQDLAVPATLNLFERREFFMDARAQLIDQLALIEDSPIRKHGRTLVIRFAKNGQTERISLPTNAQNVVTEHLMCSSLLCNAFERGIALHTTFLLNDFEACAKAYIQVMKQPDKSKKAKLPKPKQNAILKESIN